MRRREFLLGLLVAAAQPCLALEPTAVARLSPAQSRIFRAWMAQVIAAQFKNGPTPRWAQCDCAGLVRFAVAEALRDHDEKWKRANGLRGRPVPPELNLSAEQQALRHAWRLADGSRSAYVNALEMVQENTRLLGKNCNVAAPGDLLFFDQGEAQHLMVWMGGPLLITPEQLPRRTTVCAAWSCAICCAGRIPAGSRHSKIPISQAFIA